MIDVNKQPSLLKTAHDWTFTSLLHTLSVNKWLQRILKEVTRIQIFLKKLTLSEILPTPKDQTKTSQCTNC